MAYTWLSDPGEIVQPLSRDERPFAEAWADRLTRPLPPVLPLPLHRHSPECLYGDVVLLAATRLLPALRLQRCRVLGEGKHPDDEKFMAYLGTADGGR